MWGLIVTVGAAVGLVSMGWDLYQRGLWLAGLLSAGMGTVVLTLLLSAWLGGR